MTSKKERPEQATSSVVSTESLKAGSIRLNPMPAGQGSARKLMKNLCRLVKCTLPGIGDYLAAPLFWKP